MSQGFDLFKLLKTHLVLLCLKWTSWNYLSIQAAATLIHVKIDTHAWIKRSVALQLALILSFLRHDSIVVFLQLKFCLLYL